MSRIRPLLNRAKYAAIGAAIGAALGGLISRSAASTGGAVGGLVGATYAEARLAAGDTYSELKEETARRLDD